MYVRRDYSQPFFTRRKKRPYFRWAVLLALMAVLIYIGYVVATQPGVVVSAYTMLFTDTTPTPQPGTLVALANDFYLAGELEEAARLYEEALQQRPENADYLYEYGQISIDLDQPEDGLSAGEKINALNPEDPRGMALRARALVWQSQYSTAIPIVQAALQIDPNFSPLYEALSRAYIGTQQWSEGLDAGLRAVELAPDDVRARWAYASALIAVGARDKAIIELENTITTQPTFIPPHFELAFLYLSADRDQEAIDVYDRIIGMQPRNARALLRQCEAYRKVGEFQRALGRCEDAVTADPTYADAQYRLGTLRYNRREFDLALNSFEACANIEPENLDCAFRLGLAHYYVAQTTYQNCVNTGGTDCNVRQDCETAWTLLETSLGRAQLQEGLSETSAIISEGLRAIAADPACPGFFGRAPEVTPEPES